MTWRYAVIRKTRRCNGKTLHHYDIHEVYLDKKGKAHSWTDNPVNCNGFEELKTILKALAMMMKDVLEYPVMEIRKGKLVERNN